MWFKKNNLKLLILASSFFFIASTGFVFADLTINILAVNGTDQPKVKEVNFQLPAELKAEDIVDTAGLKLEYDINKGSYYVFGNVNLNPKESKTFKVKVKDIWNVRTEEIEEVKQQIDISLERIKNTEYFDIGVKRKQDLLNRIDYIVSEQEKYSNNVERRIDRFRIYATELDDIRNKALSMDYWRSELPYSKELKTLKFVITLENPLKEKSLKIQKEYFLPREVKPEHIVDAQGFEIKYDALKKQSFLYKEEELQASETKRYQFSIIDIWNVPRKDTEDLKNRTREAFKLLEKTEYLKTAEYLVSNIKNNINDIEISQAQEKSINEHISTYRSNETRYAKAKKDVESLEDLVRVLRENLERSRLKNVVTKIKSLKSIVSISQAIFAEKPSADKTWKIITWIMIFVGVITAVHFMVWGKRSKNIRIDEMTEVLEKEEQT